MFQLQLAPGTNVSWEYCPNKKIKKIRLSNTFKCLFSETLFFTFIFSFQRLSSDYIPAFESKKNIRNSIDKCRYIKDRIKKSQEKEKKNKKLKGSRLHLSTSFCSEKNRDEVR